MCKVCDNERKGKRPNFPWIGYEAASHVVVAFSCKGGGIEATATDEFTAHRIAREYKALGYIQVAVMPESKATHTQVSGLITNFLFADRFQ